MRRRRLYKYFCEHKWSEAGSAEVGVFCPPLRLSLMVIDSSNPRVFIGRQQHPVDTQATRCLDGVLHAACVVMHA
jgi:hypothetical protein